MNQDIIALASKGVDDTFRSLDVDHSGYIERHQLGVVLKRITEAFHVQDPSDQDVNEILKQLDANGDGRISKEQFKKLFDQLMVIVQDEKNKSS